VRVVSVFGFAEAIIVGVTFATTEGTPSVGIVRRPRVLVVVAITIVVEAVIIRFVVVVEIAVVGVASATATSVATSSRAVAASFPIVAWLPEVI